MLIGQEIENASIIFARITSLGLYQKEKNRLFITPGCKSLKRCKDVTAESRERKENKSEVNRKGKTMKKSPS